MMRARRSADDRARTGRAIGLSLAIFIAAVLLPFFFAAVRVVQIGFSNPASAYPVDRGTDLALWTTAIVLSVATAALAVLVFMQAKRGHVLGSGIFFGCIGALASAFNWQVICI